LIICKKNAASWSGKYTLDLFEEEIKKFNRENYPNHRFTRGRRIGAYGD
jgi:hypothetical protein